MSTASRQAPAAAASMSSRKNYRTSSGWITPFQVRILSSKRMQKNPAQGMPVDRFKGRRLADCGVVHGFRMHTYSHWGEVSKHFPTARFAVVSRPSCSTAAKLSPVSPEVRATTTSQLQIDRRRLRPVISESVTVNRSGRPKAEDIRVQKDDWRASVPEGRRQRRWLRSWRSRSSVAPISAGRPPDPRLPEQLCIAADAVLG